MNITIDKYLEEKAPELKDMRIIKKDIVDTSKDDIKLLEKRFIERRLSKEVKEELAVVTSSF